MDLADRILEEACRLLESNDDTVTLALLERLGTGTLNMLGMLYLKKQYRPEIALECLKLTSRIDKGNYLLRSNLSHVYNTLERHELAAEQGVIACEMCDIADYNVFMNTAIIMNNCQRLDDSIQFYKRALEAFPSLEGVEGEELKKWQNKLDQLLYNYGTTLMANGDYENGLPMYESRMTAYEKPAAFVSRFGKPRWEGQDLTGKSLLIFSEQGIGDLLQWARYIPELDKFNPAHIYLEAQRDAADLIASNFPNITVIPRNHENYPEPHSADYVVSICSLTYLLGYNNANSIVGKSYLVAPKRKPPRLIEQSSKLKVGLAWAGNPDHGHDFMRSCPLKNLLPLTEVEGVDFFSFQKDTHPLRKWKGEFINVHDGLESFPIKDITPFFKSFSDTAICLDHMDLIITIDSATAHLAGALGRPVWMIIPFIPDWRWMQSRPNDTHWYDSMKIYRQHKLYAWNDLIQRVKKDLQQLVNQASDR